MKLKAKHKVIPAIAMLVVSAVVLTSASYAWFTMSRTVTADGITLQAIAPTNLLISSTGVVSDIPANNSFAETATITTSYGTAKLIPASSADGLSFFAPRSLKAANAGAPDTTTVFDHVTTPVTLNADGYYADFKLWLQTTGEDDVHVTVSQILSSITDKTTTDSVNITGATRFAILDAAGTDLNIPTTANTYGVSLNSSNVSWFTTGAGTVEDPIVNKTVGPIVATSGLDFYKGSAVAAAAINSDNALVTVPGGTLGVTNTPVEITVRVWIEGQDSDCISTTGAAADFNITVGFSDVNYLEGIH